MPHFTAATLRLQIGLEDQVAGVTQCDESVAGSSGETGKGQQMWRKEGDLVITKGAQVEQNSVCTEVWFKQEFIQGKIKMQWTVMGWARVSAGL